MKSATYHHGDLRRAVLKAALRLVERRGATAVTMREVARGCGVSHNAPYRHFPSVASLRIAIATEGFHCLREVLAKAAATSKTANRKRAIGRAYVEFALKRPRLHDLMFSPESARSRDPDRVAAGEAALSVLTAALKGPPHSADTRVRGLRAWALVFGTVALVRAGQIEASDPALAQMLGDIDQD